MLSKKDLENIRTIIREELLDLVTMEWIMEVGPNKPGDPPKHTEKRKVNVLHEIGVYLPNSVGAMRGVQADINKTTNKLAKLEQLQATSIETLLTMQNPMRVLGQAAAMIEAKTPIMRDSKGKVLEFIAPPEVDE